MKRFLVAFLVCTAMLLVQTQAQAASKITVIVASSVDTSEQNYMNVTYKKLVELAQKYSDNAFDFQLFPSMQLGDEQETVRGIQLGTIHMGLRQMIHSAAAALCQLIHGLSAGIRKSQYPGRFIKTFSRCVIPGSSQNLHIRVVPDVHDHCVASGDGQGQEGRLQFRKG